MSDFKDKIKENKWKFGGVVVVALLLISSVVVLQIGNSTETVVLPEDSSGLFEEGELNRVPVDDSGEPLQGFENAEVGDSVDEFDLENADTSNVEDMSYMFGNAEEFNQDISEWDVSNVRLMTNMFFNAEEFNQDISEWDVSNVESMSGMFAYSSFNQDISEWDVSNVRDMSVMFRNNVSFNQDISEWNVRNVENMNRMFHNALAFEQDLSSWCAESIDTTRVLSPDSGQYDFLHNFVVGSPLEGQQQLHPQFDC